MKKRIIVDLEEETVAKLTRLAAGAYRSRNNLIVRILEEAVRDREKEAKLNGWRDGA